MFERLDIPSQPVRLPNDLLRDPHLADVKFFAANFAGETPVQRTLRQASEICIHPVREALLVLSGAALLEDKRLMIDHTETATDKRGF